MLTELRTMIAVLALDVAYRAAKDTCRCGMPATAVDSGALVCDSCTRGGRNYPGGREELRHSKLVRKLVSIYKTNLPL